MQLSKDWREFLALLESAEVRYLVVGGLAVVAHGYVRMTGDIDFWIATDAGNAGRVAAVIADFGFHEAGLKPADFMTPNQVFMFGRPPQRIDLLTSISGCEFEPCFARRIMIALGGMQVPFLSLPDLLTNKRATGRLKDLADVEEFERAGLAGPAHPTSTAEKPHAQD